MITHGWGSVKWKHMKGLLLNNVICFYYTRYPTHQYKNIPTTSVPPSDLVNHAKMKVGIATIISMENGLKTLGSPFVTSAGTKRALKIATGISSSHSISNGGSWRFDRKNNGTQRGMKDTIPIPITSMRYLLVSIIRPSVF